MAFVQITDPDKVVALYEAGLLWDQYHRGSIKPAERWRADVLRHWTCSDAGVFRFYILLED